MLAFMVCGCSSAINAVKPDATCGNGGLTDEITPDDLAKASHNYRSNIEGIEQKVRILNKYWTDIESNTSLADDYDAAVEIAESLAYDVKALADDMAQESKKLQRAKE